MGRHIGRSAADRTGNRKEGAVDLELKGKVAIVTGAGKRCERGRAWVTCLITPLVDATATHRSIKPLIYNS